jgi:cell division protein FtsB
MKWLVLILLLLLAFLQYRLWVGEGSLAQIALMKHAIEKQERDNAHLRARNQALASDIEALKSGESVEDRARRDMGMIRNDESFVLIVDEKSPAVDAKKSINNAKPPSKPEPIKPAKKVPLS